MGAEEYQQFMDYVLVFCLIPGILCSSMGSMPGDYIRIIIRFSRFQQGWDDLMNYLLEHPALHLLN